MELRHHSVVDAEEYIRDPHSFERKDVMKQIVGPILTDFLRPLYEQEITDEEARCFLNRSSIMYPYLWSFSGAAWDVMNYRVSESLAKDENIELLQSMNRASLPPIAYYDLSPGATHAMQSLFYYPKVKRVIDEGTRSGVVVPVNVAKQILNIERPDNKDKEEFRRFSIEETEAVQSVLRRKETEKILITLTKGPNGFLGTDSTMIPERGATNFFKFGIEYKDAYKIQSGRVVGLSDEYHIAAEEEREQLRNAGDRGSLSTSGCPVRHRFEDEKDEKQEPLVITAKNFAVRALEVAKEQSQQ